MSVFYFRLGLWLSVCLAVCGLDHGSLRVREVVMVDCGWIYSDMPRLCAKVNLSVKFWAEIKNKEKRKNMRRRKRSRAEGGRERKRGTGREIIGGGLTCSFSRCTVHGKGSECNLHTIETLVRSNISHTHQSACFSSDHAYEFLSTPFFHFSLLCVSHSASLYTLRWLFLLRFPKSWKGVQMKHFGGHWGSGNTPSI